MFINRHMYFAMFGMNIVGGYSFGLAWDFPISEIGGFTSGSPEFFLRYCFDLGIDSRKGTGKHILNY